MKLMVKATAASSGQAWRAAGVAALGPILGLGLMCGFPVAAQEPEGAAQTNDVFAAEVLARLSEMIQSAESGQLEEMVAHEDGVATNGLGPAGSPNQTGSRFGRSDHSDNTNRIQGPSSSQGDDRRSRGRRSYRSKSEPPRSSGSSGDYSRNGGRSQANAFPGTNGGPASLDYSAFRIIVDRNIFDPNRYPRRSGDPRVRTPPKTVDSVTLVGTMSYERGAFAFFDGSSSEYKKALKLTDVIAGFKVTNIAPNAVRLTAGTNELELRVGMQLRRDEDGPWLLASHAGSYAAAPASTSTNATAATTVTGANATSGSAEAESDIIKRLMQRREQE